MAGRQRRGRLGSEVIPSRRPRDTVQRLTCLKGRAALDTQTLLNRTAFAPMRRGCALAAVPGSAPGLWPRSSSAQ